MESGPLLFFRGRGLDSAAARRFFPFFLSPSLFSGQRIVETSRDRHSRRTRRRHIPPPRTEGRIIEWNRNRPPLLSPPPSPSPRRANRLERRSGTGLLPPLFLLLPSHHSERRRNRHLGAKLFFSFPPPSLRVVIGERRFPPPLPPPYRRHEKKDDSDIMILMQAETRQLLRLFLFSFLFPPPPSFERPRSLMAKRRESRGLGCPPPPSFPLSPHAPIPRLGYGPPNRVGLWRLFEVLDKHHVRFTVFFLLFPLFLPRRWEYMSTATSNPRYHLGYGEHFFFLPSPPSPERQQAARLVLAPSPPFLLPSWEISATSHTTTSRRAARHFPFLPPFSPPPPARPFEAEGNSPRDHDHFGHVLLFFFSPPPS